MLTNKQRELLMFIQQRLAEKGVSPSYEEMKDALDLKSKSGIHRLITALEERGFIRRLPNRARALEIKKLPEGSAGRRTLSVVENKKSQSGAGNDNQVMSVPMMGRIAAGVPISAIQNHTHDVAVATEMLGKGEHFALEVKGDSMIDAGILDGDTAVVKQTQTADPGDIVVALVEEEEATLKRFRRKGDSIALEPANQQYETRIFGPDQVRIQGKLVGLIRKYH